MSIKLLGSSLVILCWSVALAEEDRFQLSDGEKKLLELTNAERKKENLPPLEPNPLLFKIARTHSANMAKQEKMEHKLDGQDEFDRLKKAGYRYALAGENIAWSDELITLPEIMQGWMNSPGHRANILGKVFTQIGLGIARNAKGEIYYTQVFARPR